jgi:hypothetical protein
VRIEAEGTVQLEFFSFSCWACHSIEPRAGSGWVIGWGGQRPFVLPSDDLVVAMNAGNYGLTGTEQSHIAATVMTEAMLPSAGGDREMVRD